MIQEHESPVVVPVLAGFRELDLLGFLNGFDETKQIRRIIDIYDFTLGCQLKLTNIYSQMYLLFDNISAGNLTKVTIKLGCNCL